MNLQRGGSTGDGEQGTVDRDQHSAFPGRDRLSAEQRSKSTELSPGRHFDADVPEQHQQSTGVDAVRFQVSTSPVIAETWTKNCFTSRRF